MNRIFFVLSSITAAALLLTWSGQEQAKQQVSRSNKKPVEKKAETATAQAKEITKAAEAKPQTQEVAAKKDLNQVRILSEKVFLNDEEKALMKESLLAEQSMQQLRVALNSAELLKAKNFKKRLQHLDALYEGLKSKDVEVREKYGQLTAEILAQTPSAEIRSDKKKLKEFFGDRVEIALSASKLDAGTFESIRSHSTALKAESVRYFRRAAEMAEIYQVAL